jgi:branched-chain amino acid transport system permease protein
VRDDEVAAALAGISVARTQVVAFAVSAGAAGLAGGLLGLTTGGVIPDAFSVGLSISLLAGMVLGGTGSLLGAWWGAAILVYAPQWASSVANDLHLRQGQSSNLALLFYGLVLIVVILVAPHGVQGGLRRISGLATARLGAGARSGLSVSPDGEGDGAATATVSSSVSAETQPHSPAS